MTAEAGKQASDGKASRAATLRAHLSEYGMLVILVLIGAFFSLRTWSEQSPVGAEAGTLAVEQLLEAPASEDATVIIAGGPGALDREFTEAAAQRLQEAGLELAAVLNGPPVQLRQQMDIALAGGRPVAMILTARYASLGFLQQASAENSELSVFEPKPYFWPSFLKRDNLINIANQIVVIAILAIGMTMVIITGGIDLSVGSLIALGAVVAAWLIGQYGAEGAATFTIIWCSLAAIIACALCGLCSGLLVAIFGVPPFIVTLGFMLVASGLAYIISGGESIYQLPGNYTFLGRGYMLGLPVGVWLMALLYLLAQIFLAKTVLGRYIYAVGGNAEAARLSGVPVGAVLVFVYTMSALLAGVGGIVTASQLRSGSPQYGLMYELYVIAAVVVGGTSLSGGEGRIIGTLLGAFLIAVIQNGMNLTGVESYTQKIVLGLVILLAVLLDTIRSKGWPKSLTIRHFQPTKRGGLA